MATDHVRMSQVLPKLRLGMLIMDLCRVAPESPYYRRNLLESRDIFGRFLANLEVTVSWPQTDSGHPKYLPEFTRSMRCRGRAWFSLNRPIDANIASCHTTFSRPITDQWFHFSANQEAGMSAICDGDRRGCIWWEAFSRGK